MTACLILLGIFVQRSEATGNMSFSYAAIAMVFVFQFGSCTSWLILAYSYPVEILKYSQRAKGTAAAQAVGYAFAFLAQYTSPIAIANISWKYYIANAGWNLAILGLVAWLFVETKGRTLEDIDAIFERAVDTEGLDITTVVVKDTKKVPEVEVKKQEGSL
jgi:hypothetical protein